MLSSKLLSAAVACSNQNHGRLWTALSYQLRNSSRSSIYLSSFSRTVSIHQSAGLTPARIRKMHSTSLDPTGIRQISTTSIDLAARKGTREKREKLKKKRKKEPEVKKSFLEKLMDKKAKMAHIIQRPPDNSHLPEPLDNVYFYERFQDKIWSFADAIQNHREFLHPTMRNFPKSTVIARIDIDLVYPNRPNKFMDTWKSLVEMKSSFLSPGMVVPKILAFCLNDHEAINDVIQAGADTVGSVELIKSIQEGHLSLNDYDHVIAHPLMVIELTTVRGLMKRKFPSTKQGTVDTDLVSVVRKLKSGIKVEVQRTDREPDFAWIECAIGKLDMSVEDLEANFMAILKDTLPRRVAGKPAEDFIVQCSLKAAHTNEKFILDKNYYISQCEVAKGEVKSAKGDKLTGKQQQVIQQEKEKISASVVS